MSEYIKTNDTVYFTANFYHPISGYSRAPDVTPQWLVYENNGTSSILNGSMAARTNVPGSYFGSFVASVANGFDVGAFYDVQVSGSIDSITRVASVKQFVLDDIYNVNIVQVSGEYVSSGFETLDANIVSVSGTPVSINDFRTDISGLDQDIYFAAIKYVADATNNRDEFAVHWFKNDQPVSSGSLTNPRISVYNTATGASVLAGQAMTYASPNIGVVRYNTVTTLLASGEPYLVETSGTIDSITRTWRSIVGVDLL